MAKLVITAGPDVGREFNLSDTQTLGRLATNAIPLNDAGTSRQHTRVFRQKYAFHVVDLNSSNGTLVNGDRVEKAVLAHGDLIAIGNTVLQLVLDASDRPPAAGPSTTAGTGAAAGAFGAATSPGSARDFTFGDAGAGARTVSDKMVGGAARKTESRGGLLGADLSQFGPAFKALLWIAVPCLVAALGWWCYRLTAA